MELTAYMAADPRISSGNGLCLHFYSGMATWNTPHSKAKTFWKIACVNSSGW
jgi:hypothetical protein